MDALEVHQPCVPELELDPGQRVHPVQQGLGRVLAQHVPDLVGPVDDDGLDGVQQAAVQRGEPARRGGGVARPPRRGSSLPNPRPHSDRPPTPTSSPESHPPIPGSSSQPPGEAGGFPRLPARGEPEQMGVRSERSAPPRNRRPALEDNVQDGASWPFRLGLSGPGGPARTASPGAATLRCEQVERAIALGSSGSLTHQQLHVGVGHVGGGGPGVPFPPAGNPCQAPQCPGTHILKLGPPFPAGGHM